MENRVSIALRSNPRRLLRKRATGRCSKLQESEFLLIALSKAPSLILYFRNIFIKVSNNNLIFSIFFINFLLGK